MCELYNVHVYLPALFTFSTETGSSDGEFNRVENNSDCQMAVGNNLMNDSLSEDTCMSSLGSTSGEASDSLTCWNLQKNCSQETVIEKIQ